MTRFPNGLSWQPAFSEHFYAKTQAHIVRKGALAPGSWSKVSFSESGLF